MEPRNGPTIRCTCQKCQHVFDAEVIANAPVKLVAASWEAIRCPQCGSAKVGLGGNYSDSPDPSAALPARVNWWRTRGEHGISSRTIWNAFGGGELIGDRHDIPHDPDDFRRCHQLLTLFPEWRAQIGKVAEVFPYWKPFTDKWDEIERLYIRELPSGRAPQAYALIKECEKESSELKRKVSA